MISEWIAAAFFFVRRPIAILRIERTLLADLLVDGNQFSDQLLAALVLSDLGLRLAQSGGRRKRFSDGLSIHSACESNLRIMSLIAGLDAMA